MGTMASLPPPPNGGTSNHRTSHPTTSSPTGLTAGASCQDTASTVVPLNAAAELFAALAESIRGSAVDWPPTALEKLEQRLLERYGDLVGGEPAIERLVELASQPEAA